MSTERNDSTTQNENAVHRKTDVKELPQPIPPGLVRISLFMMMVLGTGILGLIVCGWPNAKSENFCNILTVSPEQRLIILVTLTGALGAIIHMINSFVTYHGEKKLYKSWLAWYLVRPFIGASLAVMIYLVIRGGLVSWQPTGKDDDPQLNIYGILSIAGLAGMFADNAIIYLRGIFDKIFDDPTKAKRDDPLKEKTEAEKKVEAEAAKIAAEEAAKEAEAAAAKKALAEQARRAEEEMGNTGDEENPEDKG